MLEGGGVEGAAVARLVAEHHQVQRREVARRVVEEHVLRARVRRADRAGLRAGVPVVDGGVELDAGISRRPGGVADLFPQIARLQRLHRCLPSRRAVRFQSRVVFDGLEELVRDAHGVVRVLAGDGQVGFAVPIGVVGREVDVGVALLGELDDAQAVVLRHEIALGFA